MSFQYSDKYRKYSCDMHVNDWDESFLSQFQPEELAECIIASNSNAAMMYVQSHYGYSYWPTKVGEIHPGLKGNEDAFKRLFDKLHQGGVDLIIYFSMIYNNWAYNHHPEWRIVDVNGNYSRDKGRRFGLCCPNNREYIGFCREQILDFSAYIGPYEAFFADMAFWPTVCYCDSCRKRWEEEVGGEMPTLVDWKDERWLKFQQKRCQWLGDYQKAIYDAVKEANPSCSVEQQNSVMLSPWINGVNENATLASDGVSGDLYGGFTQQTFACKMYYNMTPNLPFNYTTSRCEPSLDEHTTTKPVNIMKLHAMLSCMHHGSNIFVDAIDPVGTFDRRVYDSIKEVYDELKTFEPYFSKGTPAVDVGIYFNLDGKFDPEAEPLDISLGGKVSRAMPHLNSSLNVSETLQQAHVPYGVYTSSRPDKWGQARMLVLSDAPNVSQENIDALRAYVKNGGVAYLSGHSALPFVEEVFDGQITARTDESIVYMAPTEAGQELMEDFTVKYPMTVYDSAFLLEKPERGKVLATLTLPYSLQASTFLICADLELQKEADLNDPRNESVSMHSDPPGIPTEYPAIIEAEYGAGKVIWACAPFEDTELCQQRKVFSALIDRHVPDRRFYSDGPYVVECQLWEDKEKGESCLNVINLQYHHEVLPVFDFCVEIPMKGKPAAVTRVSDGKDMELIYENGRLVIHIDRLDLYEMFAIQ